MTTYTKKIKLWYRSCLAYIYIYVTMVTTLNLRKGKCLKFFFLTFLQTKITLIGFRKTKRIKVMCHSLWKKGEHWLVCMRTFHLMKPYTEGVCEIWHVAKEIGMRIMLFSLSRWGHRINQVFSKPLICLCSWVSVNKRDSTSDLCFHKDPIVLLPSICKAEAEEDQFFC